MACAEYKAILPKYADGSLGPDQVRLLRDHLPACESCRKTVRLLKLDDNAIRKMLFGRQHAEARSRRRLSRSALFFGMVLLLTLVGLYLAYRSLGPSEPAGLRAVDALNLRISLDVESMELDEFLLILRKRARVQILLTDAAKERWSSPPPVSLSVRSSTLREILARLGGSHGLTYRTDKSRILLE